MTLLAIISIILVSLQSMTLVIAIDSTVFNDCLNMKEIRVEKEQDISKILDGNLTNTCLFLQVDSVLTVTIKKDDTHNFFLIGNKIRIRCNGPHVGISFVNSSNIKIFDVRFRHCGGKFESFTLPPPEMTVKPNISSAIYFRQTHNIHFNKVTIHDSKGYGMVMFDCFGVTKLSFLHVTNGQLVPYSTSINGTTNNITGYSSGGGLYIEYTKSEGKPYQSENSITCYHCHFTKNHAEQEKSSDFDSKSHIQFGSGGGLSIFFRGNSSRNRVEIIHTIIDYNAALWGGGVFVGFESDTLLNSVAICSSSINDNSAVIAGGGIRIFHDGIQKSNSISLNNSYIFKNSAQVGGGYSQQSMYLIREEAKSVLDSCTFEANNAIYGSAVYLHKSKVIFQNNTRIASNMIHKENPVLVGYGALYAYLSYIKVTGITHVEYNNFTSLVLDSSQLKVNGEMQFVENSGVLGGAISLYFHSRIVLTKQTKLLFVRNSADKGGAIYVKVPGPWVSLNNSIIAFPWYSCFFGNYNQEFVGNVKFDKNSANRGADIFATTLQHCLKGKDDSLNSVITSWVNFHFTIEGSVVTEPVHIEVAHKNWYSRYLGEEFNVNITLFDEKSNQVDGTVEVLIESDSVTIGLEKQQQYLVRNGLIQDLFYLSSNKNARFNISLYHHQTKIITLSDVYFEYCPFGYMYTNKSNLNRCVCENKKNQDRGIAFCDGLDIYMFENMWSKPNAYAKADDGELILTCPHDYCKKCDDSEKKEVSEKFQINGYACKYLPNQQCSINRTENSSLCSQCKPNLSVKFGSEDCYECKGNKWYAMFLVLVFGILLGVFLTLMLNIDIYDNYLNSVIFFYQVEYLLHTPTQRVDPCMRVISGLINLNGADGYLSFCLYDGMNNLDKMLINYLLPVGSIIFLLIFWFISCCCPNSFIYKNKCFNAIVFILMFAYGDITRITFALLHGVKIDTSPDNGRKYYIYAVKELSGYVGEPGIVSVLVVFFLLFVLILPFALALVEVCIKYCVKLKTLTDHFNRCFKENLLAQAFPSFYFFCRLILLFANLMLPIAQQTKYLVMVVLCVLILCLFCFVKPYKDNAGKALEIKRYRISCKMNMNQFDICVLVNLAAIAILSNGKRKLSVKEPMDPILNVIVQVLLWPPLVLPLLLFIQWIITKINEWILQPLYQYRMKNEGTVLSEENARMYLDTTI